MRRTHLYESDDPTFQLFRIVAYFCWWLFRSEWNTNTVVTPIHGIDFSFWWYSSSFCMYFLFFRVLPAVLIRVTENIDIVLSILFPRFMTRSFHFNDSDPLGPWHVHRWLWVSLSFNHQICHDLPNLFKECNQWNSFKNRGFSGVFGHLLLAWYQLCTNGVRRLTFAKFLHVSQEMTVGLLNGLLQHGLQLRQWLGSLARVLLNCLHAFVCQSFALLSCFWLWPLNAFWREAKTKCFKLGRLQNNAIHEHTSLDTMYSDRMEIPSSKIHGGRMGSGEETTAPSASWCWKTWPFS